MSCDEAITKHALINLDVIATHCFVFNHFEFLLSVEIKTMNVQYFLQGST